MTEGWAVVANGSPLERAEEAIPMPTDRQVLLDVTHCGVCHSDLYFQDGYYDLGNGEKLSLADRGVKLPFIPGHETVGRVSAVGPDVTDVKPGDLRLVYPWAGCGDCPRCNSGSDHLCQAPNSLGVHRPGGYGSQVRVDRPEHLLDISGIDTALAATLACSGLTAYSAVRKLDDVGREEPVVVIGAGGLGLAAVSILSALGYQKIVTVDVSDAKLEAATSVGSHIVVNGGKGNFAEALVDAAGGPIVGCVDFVSSSDTAKAAVDALGRGGVYVAVGLFGGSLELKLPLIPLRAICIRGSYTGSLQELRELIDMAKEGKLAGIPIERVPHSNPNKALDMLRVGENSGRLVLDTSKA